jgi:hypothetical protein
MTRALSSKRSRRPAGFMVMRRQCATCIYRKDSPLDLERLENDVRETHRGATGFKGHRVCHHRAEGRQRACCRGFWNRHKDQFATGQIAQRLGFVVFVEPTEETQ